MPANKVPRRIDIQIVEPNQFLDPTDERFAKVTPQQISGIVAHHCSEDPHQNDPLDLQMTFLRVRKLANISRVSPGKGRPMLSPKSPARRAK